MRFFLGLRSLILTLFRKILFLWVRTDVSGNSVEALGVDPEKPVCYVLQYSSLSSRGRVVPAGQERSEPLFLFPLPPDWWSVSSAPDTGSHQ